MRKFSFVVIVLLLIASVNLTFAQNSKSEKKEKIIGTVIAQYSMNALLCAYHPCAVWLIVRLDQSQNKEPLLARVTVEYFPNDNLSNRGFPIELVKKTKKWKFSAVRNSSRDTAIEKYVNSVDATGKNITEEIATPAWILLPGAENEKIPVGEILPYYFVKTGDYEKYKKQ